MRNETHNYFAGLLKRVEERMRKECTESGRPQDSEVSDRTMLYIRHWFVDENGFEL